MLPIFDKGEWICASLDEYGIDLIPVENLNEEFTFISINPFLRKSTRRDANVAIFRNFLVELDKVPLREQRSLLRTSGLPLTMLTYSGGKSLHAIISLEVPLETKAEYKAMCRRIYKAFPQADKANSNPSRFSRNPNHYRATTGYRHGLILSGSRISHQVLESWLQSKGVTKEAGHIRKVEFERPPLAPGQRWPISARTWQFIREGAPLGKRHSEAIQAAFDFAQCGWPLQEAHYHLSKGFPDADPNELENILEHCYRKTALAD